MQINSESIFLIVFLVIVIALLLMDLLIIGRKSHVVSLKEATIWSFIWIGLALVFAIYLRHHGEKVHGVETFDDLKLIVSKFIPNLQLTGSSFEENLEIYRKSMTINYLTGYLIEKTLSIDNLFVILMILSAFSVPLPSYKPVLFWGILGAIILRFIFIFAGVALIRKFGWILLIFGLYLVYTGVMMFIKRNKDEKIEPKDHIVFKILSKWFRVFPDYVGNRFFIRKERLLYITPLFIVLIFIEMTDVIFATDSIPAIFAVSLDPYVVFFSNIFAILGLRSLFFLLVHVVNMFHYLKTGISVLLVYVGLKLLLHEWLDEIGFKTVYSLYFILFVLVASIVFSLLIPDKNAKDSKNIPLME